MSMGKSYLRAFYFINDVKTFLQLVQSVERRERPQKFADCLVLASVADQFHFDPDTERIQIFGYVSWKNGSGSCSGSDLK